LKILPDAVDQDILNPSNDRARVDSLVPPGHASTHGYPDPGYPIEGRKAI
jgi:hypothetical protein